MINVPLKKIRTEMSDQDKELSANDLNRFSRQNAALGAETTAKLIKMRVIIAGLRGEFTLLIFCAKYKWKYNQILFLTT